MKPRPFTHLFTLFIVLLAFTGCSVGDEVLGDSEPEADGGSSEFDLSRRASDDAEMNDQHEGLDAEVPAEPSCVSETAGLYCGDDANMIDADSDTLYRCDGAGSARVEQQCGAGCIGNETGDDACGADAAVCDSDAQTGFYCAGDKVSGGAEGTLYRCNGPGGATISETCADGCVVAPSGQDDHCAQAGATCDSDASTGFYCAGDKVSGGVQGTLYRCDGPGMATASQSCAHGCAVASAGSDDYCKSPPATCDAGASTGYYCAGDKVSGGAADTLYRCDGPGAATKPEKCARGCIVAPSGSDDYCKPESTPGTYKLPYACNATYRCSSANSTSNHSGTDRYAYDFAVPVGTSVKAMRAGVVHRVRKVSRPGSACYNGGGSACANLANTVEVRHSDGTIGLYMHVSSISVSTGQTVQQGQEVAKSGNSGWSTGPHLHVQLQSNCGIWWCQSKPLRFAEGNVTTGSYVKSNNCRR